MIRIEIIANRSVEENILEALKDEGVGKYYTKYPNVFGVGTSGPRMGDAIWPEENFALVFWCDYEEALGIENAVASVKEHFPDEGIKVFGLPEHESAFRTVPVQTRANVEPLGKSPVIEAPIDRYNPFQAETRPGYAATDRFTAPDSHAPAVNPLEARTESSDSFMEKAARRDTFEEETAEARQSHHPDQMAAETGRSTAMPADVDNWLGQSFVQETPPAPASGPDTLEQEPVPVREAPPQTGYGEWYHPQPEERAQTTWTPQPSPSPEPEQTPVAPSNGNAGMEDENF